MAARNGTDGREEGPLPPEKGLLVLRHPPQQHQQHHEDMLGDRRAVGPGGVGQQAIRVGPDGVVQQVVHPGGGGAQPAQGSRARQQLRRDVAE